MIEKTYYVYILTNTGNKVLYIGVTRNLLNRTVQHKEKISAKSFTNKYNCDRLVYFELFNDVSNAIAREKQLKNWHRQWKINLINDFNPGWIDLFSIIDTSDIEEYLERLDEMQEYLDKLKNNNNLSC